MGSQQMNGRRYVGWKESLVFGLANGGQNVSLHVITFFLNYFFINVFNINSSIVAIMLLVEGIWDTINDPLMGAVIDRTRTRWGKLRPFLLGVPVPLALTTVALFAGPLLIANPSQNAVSKVVYMVATYFLWETLFTVADISFWSMSAAISPNPGDRTKAITSARFLAGVFGGFANATVPVLLDLSNKTGGIDIKKAFLGIGIMTGIAGMGIFSLAGFKVKERVAQSDEEPSIRECLECIVKNPPLRYIIFKDFIGALGNVGGAFTTYFYLDVLGSASYSIAVGLVSAITDPISYLLIPAVKKKLDNKQITIYAQIFTSILNAGAYFIGIRRKSNVRFMVVLMIIKFGIEALANGVTAVIPTEMIAETVDYMEWKTGMRPEGINFSVLSFFRKLSSVAARALGAFLLKPIGYQTSAANAVVPQSERTKQGIWFMFMAFPVIFRLLSLLPMFFYDLVGAKRETMLAQLAARRLEPSDELPPMVPPHKA